MVPLDEFLRGEEVLEGAVGELVHTVGAFLEHPAAVQQMRQDLVGRALAPYLLHARQGPFQLMERLGAAKLRLAAPHQPDRDALEELGLLLHVHRDAVGGLDPAPPVPVAEQHGEGRVVQTPAGLREDALTSSVQGADHRAEQRGAGQTAQGGVLGELLGQIPFQLGDGVVVVVVQPGGPVPGGDERLDVLVPHRGAQRYDERHRAVERGQLRAECPGRGMCGQPPQQCGLPGTRVAPQENPGAVGEQRVDALGCAQGLPGRAGGVPLCLQAEIRGVQVPLGVAPPELVARRPSYAGTRPRSRPRTPPRTADPRGSSRAPARGAVASRSPRRRAGRSGR
ncbi:hypothetical protein [Streptomyces atratus]|uniref:hypothetical protein n=1 Tax=Streptomyces atratus TaxID=1893 RepID=UPI0033D83C31